ncbi:expressed unknown protein [Seminavis robusta]|uniref:Calcineurin-like phosphoesterase domain-containing protein n=1 Tax=Seminavis robusta TaxID=568900 RepID=A0A9N8HU84_9STRA|nr:expressed unknown protein [Seminavis robusta]|eukprot:Sro1709_g292730.1 n/a (445) ;mRNA; f:20464-21798
MKAGYWIKFLGVCCLFLPIKPSCGLFFRASPPDHDSDVTNKDTPSPPYKLGDPFTIIFFSDLETHFRGHDIYRSRYVVRYIRDLRHANLTYDGNYSHVAVDPQLVIHGGDVGHLWNCFGATLWEFYLRGAVLNDYDAHNFNNWQCQTPLDEIRSLWDIFYQADMPFVSNFGNHDWYPAHGTGNPWVRPAGQRDAVADRINRQSSEFVRETYRQSERLGLEVHDEILPTAQYGQSMFHSVFRGVRLVSFNAAFNWESYDDHGTYNATQQLERLQASLLSRGNHNATIFYSHFPLSKHRLRNQAPSVDEVVGLMAQFADSNHMVHHFAGHYHAERVEDYNTTVTTVTSANNNQSRTVTVRDHVAAYPHRAGQREPGFWAILVSPTDGVLQVKSITIPGLPNGSPCTPAAHKEPLGLLFGTTYKGCDTCKAGKHVWSFAHTWFVCGD